MRTHLSRLLRSSRPSSILLALMLALGALAAASILDGGTASAQTISTPTLNSVTATNAGMKLTWTRADPKSADRHAGFEIQRSDDGTNFTTVTASNVGTSRTSWTDNMSGVTTEDLASGQSWTYRLRAHWQSTDTLQHNVTSWSNEVTGTVPTLPKPTAVTVEYSAAQFGRTNAAISWSAPTLSWSNDSLSLSGYDFHTSQVVHWSGSDTDTTVLDLGDYTLSLNTTSENTWFTSSESSDGTYVRYEYRVSARYGKFLSGRVLAEEDD